MERVAAGFELVDYVLYDSVALRPGRISLFCVPVGQQGKSFADTNMMLAAQLASPQTFSIFWISALILRDGIRELVSEQPLYSAIDIEMEILNKMVWRGTALQAASIQAFIAAPSEHEEIVAQMESWRPVDFRASKITARIEQAAMFQVRAYCPAAHGSAIIRNRKIEIILGGQLLRPQW